MLHVVHLPTLQAPITADMLEGAPCVLRFSMSEKRGLTAEAEVEIVNPGLSALSLSHYLAVVETDGMTLANPHILCRARISAVPTDLKARTIVLTLTCCPESHKEDLRAAANVACAGAAIPPWTVKVVPQPDPGIVTVLFSGAPGSAATYPAMRGNARKVDSFFQQDLVRSPYARLLWSVLTVQNALLILTVPMALADEVFFAAKENKFAIIGISNDADPTHSTFYTYGVVMRAGPSPGGGVDVEVNLADPRLTGSGFAYAEGDPTRAGLPHFDPLFGSGGDDLSLVALEGRSQSWFIDPVSHEISLDELLGGRRVVDLGGLGDEASTEFTTGQSPVRHVKLRVIAEWEQHAIGRTNLAPIIATTGSARGYLTTLQDKVKEPKGDPKLEFNTWGGWTKGTPSFTIGALQSAPFHTGRTITVTYQSKTVYNGTVVDGVVTLPYEVRGTPFTVNHNEFGRFNIRTVTYQHFWCSFEYSQPRREILDLILDCDAQPTFRGTDTLELPTVTLGDLLAVAGVAPFQDGTIYNRGDRVLIFGHVWECTADGVIAFYTPVAKTNTGTGGLSVELQYLPVYWLDRGTLAPLADARSPSFLDTERGRGVMRHALMRMRAAALKRLEMLTISRTYPWELARDLDLRDQLRIEVRDGDGLRAYVGKVVAIDRVIDAQATVKITIKVPLGTGRADAVEDVDDSAYGEDDYGEEDYGTRSTPTYLVPSEGGYSAAFAVNGDIEAVVQADDMFVPVDAYRLQDPSYAVRECNVLWEADSQIAECLARMARGHDPQLVQRDHPTELRISMRVLHTYPTLERFARVHAALLTSPRGVSLAGVQP